MWGQPLAESSAFDLPVTVNPPRERLRAMYEAATLAEREQYPAAVKALQSVLESPEDYFLEHDLQATLKQRALALLASWPQAGRDAYERQYSTEAALLLERAQRFGARDDWSRLLSQYWMTPAGRAAAELWAAQSFDIGEPFAAARYWLQLRETHGQPEKEFSAGIKESLAWELAGRPDLRRARLALFGMESNWNPVVLGGRTFAGKNAVDEATEWIGSHVVAPAGERGQRIVRNWSLSRGDGARNAVALPAGPIGPPVWTTSLLGEICDPLIGDASPYRRAVLQQTNSDLEERLRLEDRLTIPAAVPVVNQNTVAVRTLSGLAAFDLETGALRWRSSLDDSLFRRQWNTLPKEPPTADTVPASQPALQQLLRERVFRDSLLGTIACNQRVVFALESNLEVPQPMARNVIRPVQEMPDPVNRLVAFDLRGGQLLWELGGPRGDAELPLAGHFFLGPPLVREDELYCLAEVDSELRLLQLQLDAETHAVSLIWSQVLVAPDQPVSTTALRRLSGLTPTWAEGLLICPTGCGVLVAVDPLRRQLAWGFKYESVEPRQLTQRTLMMMRAAGNGRIVVPVRPDEEQSRWADATPIYAQGHVIFTPRDGLELVCLDAVSGDVVWRRQRGSSLMIAGVQQDHVIVVGRSSVESWRLSDGEAVWTLPIPVPAGQGVILSQRYLLPCVENQILTIDLNAGRLLSQSQIDPAWGMGNLVAANGALLATSPRGIAKFASMNQLEADLERRLIADANDGSALALRGELRLHRGEQDAGLKDLRESLKKRPDDRTASLLASALLEGLRSNFPQFRDRAGEIDRLLVNSPARSEFLRIYAQEFSKAGEPLAAFGEYLKLIDVPDYEERMERFTGGWSVRGDRAVRGQVRSLYQSASPAVRQQLDAALIAFAARPTSNETAMVRYRRWLRFFDGLPMLDQMRVSVLTDKEEDVPLSFRLQTARQLANAPRPEHAALGAAWLAETLIARQRHDEARPWLDRLNRDYASVRIERNAQEPALTSQQVATTLTTRWQDSLAQGGWGSAEIAVQRKSRTTSMNRNIPVEVRGPCPLAWRDWTFEITDAPGAVLAARDPHGRVRWKVDVAPQAAATPFPRFNAQSVVHFLFIAGDRMVIAFTGRFVVLDLSTGGVPAVRWQHDLTAKVDANGNLPLVGQRIDHLACGRRRILATSMSDLSEASPAGQVLGLTDDMVCYVMGGRLVAADVDTGRILWIRLGVPQIVEGTATADAVTLFDLSRSQAVVYRPDDGAEIARRDVGDANTWLWFEGDRLLTVSPTEGSMTARLRQLSTNAVLWERSDKPAEVRYSMPAEGHLFEWLPNGELTKLQLSDGRSKWSATTPVVKHANVLRVERYGEHELVFLGSSAPMADNTRISVYDMNHIPFQGHAMGFSAVTGEQKWAAAVASAAMDLQARPNVPILPFVARLTEQARIVNGQFIAPVRFVGTFLDKRTGEVLFKTVETVQPQQFQWEIDSERPIATAHFNGWSMEFRKDE